MRYQYALHTGGAVLVLLLLACGSEPTPGPLAPVSAPGASLTPLAEAPWSAPVALGPVVNSTEADMQPFITRDGLSLYFSSARVTGLAATAQLFVSHRASRGEPWGAPRNVSLGTDIGDGVLQPFVSRDGHWLFFNSSRASGADIYVSWRRHTHDDFGWEAPVRLGGDINTGADEVGPMLHEDGESGTVTLYFSSRRPGMGGFDIYAAPRLADGSFGPVTPVPEFNTPFDDNRPAFRRDDREVFVTSTRQDPGWLGGTDIWVATRASTTDPWSPFVNLGPTVNTSFNDGALALSFDGTELYFMSNANRPGGLGPCFGALGPCFFDLYVITRDWPGRADDGE